MPVCREASPPGEKATEEAAAVRQGGEAMGVGVGGVGGAAQAQLEGFKSRSLRLQAANRHDRYATEWGATTVVDASATATLLTGQQQLALSMVLASHKEVAAPTHVVAAASTVQHALLPLSALEAALAQVQAASQMASSVWLVTQAAHRPQHTGSNGLARSVRTEASAPVCCVCGLQSAALATRLLLPREPEALLHLQRQLVPRLARALEATGQGAVATHDSQLVSGGTAGLGLLTARWLAQRGARALCLVSRGGAVACEVATEWMRVRATGTSTLVWRCDSATQAHVQQLMALTAGPLCLAGVWHAAGVLVDGVLASQVAGSLARVYAPKTHGACTLQRACGVVVLRACALFSSVAALLGGAGQTNYSAANACLDVLSLCHRACSRVGMAVQ